MPDYKTAWLGAEETIRDLEAEHDRLREALREAAAQRDRLLAFLRNENFEFADNGQTWRAWPAEDVDALYLAAGPQEESND